MTSPVRNADVLRARDALGAARVQRAEYLMAIAAGVLTEHDLIESAAEASGKALRKITLKQLLTASPGVGEVRAKAFLAAVADRLELDEPLATKTVGWLIDQRSGGRRLWAWLDAGQPKALPWPGFPLAPAPQAAARWAA